MTEVVGGGDVCGGTLPADVLLVDLLSVSFTEKMGKKTAASPLYLDSAAPADGGSVTDQLHRLPGIFQAERALRSSGQGSSCLLQAGGKNFLFDSATSTCTLMASPSEFSSSFRPPSFSLKEEVKIEPQSVPSC